MRAIDTFLQKARAFTKASIPVKRTNSRLEHESVGGPPFLWIHANFAWAMRADLL